MTCVCPECSTRHDLAKYKGCCSRGCMYRLNRRNRPPLVRKIPWPKPKPMAGVVAKPVGYFALQSPPPPPPPPPPPCDDMIRCDVCQTKSPDWATFDICGIKVCCSCRPAYVAAKNRRDDRARPGVPFAGGGVRVVRSTKGLS